MNSTNQKIQNMAQLCRYLESLLVANNEIRAKGEAALKEYCLSPSCLRAFGNIVNSSGKDEVRQIAVVLLRILIKRHFLNVEVPVRSFLKDVCLKMLTMNLSGPVRRGIVYCVGEIAFFETKDNKWPALGVFINKCISVKTSHPQYIVMMETGIRLFGVLLERVPSGLSGQNLKIMVEKFILTLTSPSPRLVLITLEAMEQFMKAITGNFLHPDCVLPLVEPFVQILQKAIKCNKEDVMAKCFQLSEYLAYIRSDNEVYVKMIPQLVKYHIELGSLPKMPDFVRRKAGEFVGWVIQYNTGFIIMFNMIDSILNLTLKLLMTPDPPGLDLGEMQDIDTVYGEGCSLFDTLCYHVPSQFFFDKVLAMALRLINDSNELPKRAGITMIGMMGEGCGDKLQDKFKLFVPLLVQQFQRGTLLVQMTVVMTSINLIVNCINNIWDHLETIFLNVFLRSLNHNNPHVRKRAVYGIEVTCSTETKLPFLAKYSNLLMKNLFMVLKNSNREVQTNIICAFGNIARNLGKMFLPYFKTTYDTLMMIISSNPKVENRSLKFEAITSMGLVAKGVGFKTFSPYMKGMMNFLLNDVFNKSKSEKNEYSMSEMCTCVECVKHMCCCAGPKFQPYLGKTIQKFITMLMVVPDAVVRNKTKGGFLHDQNIVATNGKQLQDLLKTRDVTLVVDENTIKLKAEIYLSFGVFALKCGSHYAQFHTVINEMIKRGIKNMHPKVTISALNCLCMVACTLEKSQNFNIKPLFQFMVATYCEKMIGHYNEDVVTAALDCVSHMLENVGRKFVEVSLEILCDFLTRLLKRDSNVKCMEDEDPNISDVDRDFNNLFDRLFNCFEKLVMTCGNRMEPCFRKMFSQILKIMTHKSVEKRTCVISLMNIVCQSFKGKSTMYSSKMLPLVSRCLQSGDCSDKMRATSLFFLSSVSKFSKRLMAASLPSVLDLVFTICSNKDQHSPYVLDASSVVLSVIVLEYDCKANNSLPKIIAALIRLLPIRKELKYLPIILNCMFKVMDNNHDVLRNNFKGFANLFQFELQRGVVNKKYMLELQRRLKILSKMKKP